MAPDEPAYFAAVFAGAFAFYLVIASSIGWAFPGRLPRVRLQLRPGEFIVRRGVSAEPNGKLTLAYRIILTNQRLVMRRQRFSGERLSLSWSPGLVGWSSAQAGA